MLIPNNLSAFRTAFEAGKYFFVPVGLRDGGGIEEAGGAMWRRSQERGSDFGLRFDHEMSMRRRAEMIGKL